MKTIYGLFVLLLILYLSVTDSQGIVCPDDRVTKTVGEDVTLRCYLHDGRGVTINQVVWWKFNDSLNVVVYRRKQVAHDDQAEQFRGRATIDSNELGKGILTMKISSVKTTDDGTYTCSFKDEDQPPVSCNVPLTVAVKGSSDKDTEVKPGPVDSQGIICHPDPVRATVGEDVTLPCHLPDGHNVTLNEIVWWKFNGSHDVVVYRMRQSAHDNDQDEQFRGRATIDRNDLDRGILTVKISSVNTTDGGTYNCSIKDGPQPPVSCNVDLTVAVKGSTDKGTEVKPGPVDKNDDGKITAGVIVGVVALVAVAVGIWMWWKRPRFIHPSEPVTAAVGENVTLSCRLHDGRDVRGKTVTWKFNDSHNVLVYRNRQIDFDDQADRFNGRATINVTGLHRGILGLKLSSVKTADSGTYTCSLRYGPLPISCKVQLTVNPAVPRNDEQEEPPQEGHRLLQPPGPNDADDGPATSCDAANSQNPAKLRDDDEREETETLEQQEKQTLLSETLIPTLRKRKESEEQSLSEHDPNQ